MRRRSLLPVLLALPACTAFSSTDDVLISSDPLGARIVIDGRDTGHTTPVLLPIGGHLGTGHEIVLEKPGYRPATRRVYQHIEGYTSKWIDGAYNLVMPPLPLFWTAGDFFIPFGVRSAILPAELHVVMQREDEPLLGFDLLAERAAAADADR